MSNVMTQHLMFEQGGTLELFLIDRPTGTPTVRLIGGDGAEVMAATNVTVSSIDTTVNGAISKGDSTVTLTNASDITAGDRFWLRTPDEEVRCKTKSGNTVTLWSPLLYAHADTVTAEGTRLSYAADSDDANVLFWDGRAEWVIDTTTYRHTHCIITKYPFYRAATVTDLVDEEPHIEQLLSDETDAERLLDRGLDDVIKQIASRQRAWVYAGANVFAQATVFAALVRCYRSQSGETGEEMYTRYKEAMTEELDRITSIVPSDLDQDGEIEADEKRSFRSIPLYRR